MVSFLIDAVLAVMLVTATVFLVIVNKRLRVLKSGQAEINGLITTFSRTIDETDASVKRLAAAATEISAKLADELDRGKVMKEEIGLLLGSCERTARRIEESVHQARALARRLDEAPMPRTRTPRSGMPLSLFDEDGGEAAPAPAAPLTATPLSARPAAEPRPTPVEDPRAAQPAQPADAPPEAPAEGSGFRPFVSLVRSEGEEPARPRAEAEADAAEDADGARQQVAASAFYARLRTVGSGA